MSGTTAPALEYGQRRGSELWLCLLALLVSIGGYAAMSVGVNGRVSTDIVTFAGWLAGLTIVAHVAVRRLAPYADPVHLYHQELVALGWTVLTLNIRASDGYGEAFYTASVGAWGEGRELLGAD